jgi:hypothetical protein
MNVWEYLEQKTPNPLKWLEYLKGVYPSIEWDDAVTITMWRSVEYFHGIRENTSYPAIAKKTVELAGYTDNKTILYVGYAPEIGVLYAWDLKRPKYIGRIHYLVVDPNDIPKKYAIDDEGEIIDLEANNY